MYHLHHPILKKNLLCYSIKNRTYVTLRPECSLQQKSYSRSQISNFISLWAFLKFAKSTMRSKCIPGLINSDIWKSPIILLGGVNYFVTFIDDYFRRCWMYLIKKKAYVFSIFQSFIEKRSNIYGNIRARSSMFFIDKKALRCNLQCRIVLTWITW